MERRSHLTTRRSFLKATGAVAVGGALLATRGEAANPQVGLALAATDGYITLPNRPGDAPLYIFGFATVPVGASVATLTRDFKAKAQTPAPLLAFQQETDIKLTLTNLGLKTRPDLTDSHTIHWHGFRTPPTVTDGVPEVSVAVPISRQFTYFYRPHDPGTYMYHCHFEDVEHVQMGMTGIMFVRPTRGPKFAYDHASTAFDREYPILLTEFWSLAHDNDQQIQENIWTDYDPDYWLMNGRVYPQTILEHDDPSLPQQPISSLIRAKAGETVLLRLANLGYQQHALQLPGIPMRVVGQDATLLRNGASDQSYRTNTLYIGPGEARDVLFTAPAYSAASPGGTDAKGSFNRYFLKNRDASKLTNAGAPGLGGMATEVRVYATLPAPALQPNNTYA